MTGPTPTGESFSPDHDRFSGHDRRLPGAVLTIVIPALNEEEAIGSTIERCLASQAEIHRAGVDDVEIIVVSDGSTDRTVEIARGFEPAGVRLIEFVRNRGYGAAIKAGWDAGSGTLLGFLDADGTCDPTYFAEMCRALRSEEADVVLGSRLGPGSKMPRVRRIGNRIFAFLLGAICGRHVTDTASGMRVVRRDALRHLLPLPDGLHFTPSMSARALLNDLRVIEIPMAYEERVGRSKLSVVNDGVRFLQTILEGVLCYRPERLFLLGTLFCLAMILLLAASPAEYYASHRRLEEWMIYRFAVCCLLGTFATTLLLATGLVDALSCFNPIRPSARGFWGGLVGAFLQSRWAVAAAAAFAVAGTFFLWPGLLEYASTGKVYMHWSRLLAGSFGLTCAFLVATFIVLLKVSRLWAAQFRAALLVPSRKRE